MGPRAGDPPSEADRAEVARLLGREPAGAFWVALREADGTPAVICNAPFLEDGTPMPTSYWLVSPGLRSAVSRLESTGGVKQAEAEVDPDALGAAHARYAATRDAQVPAGYVGPKASGGVGGTRHGVKCLHAHLAWYLVGGDDPVGEWVVAHLEDTALAGFQRDSDPTPVVGQDNG